MTTSATAWHALRGSFGLFLLVAPQAAPAEDTPSREEAADALKRAVRYFREHVATRGGYLCEYSPDLKERRGEKNATASQIWVQPPGTPSVGMACLRAYERTGDAFYLDAAREAAHALAWGQLASGGWGYSIDFDPTQSRRRFHRRDVEAGQRDPGKRFNTSTFDDDTSQSALRLLMSFDHVTGFKDEEVHRAALYALTHFLEAQYPSGGWPQRYVEPCDPAHWPIRPARYPESWSRTFPNADYKFFYTLNDYTIPDLITTMLLAWEVYGDRAYFASALRSGDFLILAQMPDPQPAWAQQYDADMLRPDRISREGDSRCIGLAGVSPAVVSTGAPRSRPRTTRETSASEWGVESLPGAIRLLAKGASQRAQHEVNLAAPRHKNPKGDGLAEPLMSR